jgi:hypothetical protein
LELLLFPEIEGVVFIGEGAVDSARDSLTVLMLLPVLERLFTEFSLILFLGAFSEAILPLSSSSPISMFIGDALTPDTNPSFAMPILANRFFLLFLLIFLLTLFSFLLVFSEGGAIILAALAALF